MRFNYLVYLDVKTTMRCPDDIYDLFLKHLEEEHPDYLYLSDKNDIYKCCFYFVNNKLVAFHIVLLD